MKALIADIKAFWQRGRRGWADRDCWSLDYYLSGVLADSIEHLKNINNGYPGIHPDSHKKDYGDPRGGGKLWIAIQDVVIDGLRAHRKLVNMEWPTEIDPVRDRKELAAWESEMERRQRVAFVLLQEYWGKLWD